jgi:hypothetical protein
LRQMERTQNASHAAPAAPGDSRVAIVPAMQSLAPFAPAAERRVRP